MRVEHDVVWALERKPGALGVERLDPARRQIHALDTAALIVLRLTGGHQTDAREIVPIEPAVVADVDLAVRSDSRAVGPAGVLCHNSLGAIGGDARQARRLDLHHQD